MGEVRPQGRFRSIEPVVAYLDLSNEANQLRLLLSINRTDEPLYDVAHLDARVQEFYARPELPSSPHSSVAVRLVV